MPDTQQRAKQWGPGRAPSTAETLHPDALIDARAADFELCSDCRTVAPGAVRTGRVFSGAIFLAAHHAKHALSPAGLAALSDGLVALRKHSLYRASAEPYLAAVSHNNNK